MSEPRAPFDASPRKRIKELEVMVADTIAETHDTSTLVFFTGNDRLDYRAGHFLTIDPHQFDSLARFTAFLEDMKGKKEPPRAYSMVSAPHEKYLAVTIKEERYVSGQTKFPPLLSPMLVRRTRIGMRLIVTGFTGPYTLPDNVESRTDTLVHLCAGSGSVPNFSILKHALTSFPSLRHVWINANKTWKDVIFRKQLAELTRQHTDRLRVVHVLSRETDAGRFGPEVLKGRVDTPILKAHIPDPGTCLVYACGPAVGPWDRAAAKEKGIAPSPRFLEAALAGLRELGVTDDRIEYESYG
ncbi:MAG: oxidoreductase [Acidobacteria bacterium]|nr:oxidoreductase [Acidobacteriota bacterium]